jgi:hypothetical protein
VFQSLGRARRSLPGGISGPTGNAWDTTSRTPLLLFQLSGLFLLRLAQRAAPPARPRINGSQSAVFADLLDLGFRQPPNNLPISATMRLAWAYWPGLSQLNS